MAAQIKIHRLRQRHRAQAFDGTGTFRSGELQRRAGGLQQGNRAEGGGAMIALVQLIGFLLGGFFRRLERRKHVANPLALHPVGNSEDGISPLFVWSGVK